MKPSNASAFSPPCMSLPLPSVKPGISGNTVLIPFIFPPSPLWIGSSTLIKTLKCPVGLHCDKGPPIASASGEALDISVPGFRS